MANYIPYFVTSMLQNITILTQKKLNETMEILISKINLKAENKEKILNLKWDGEEEIKENSNIIIIGSKQYIENKNKEISNKNVLSILDCYAFEEEKNNINVIVKEYKNVLNTLGKKEI